MDEEKDIKGIIFTIIVIAGFALIFIFVPRLVQEYGLNHGKTWGKGIGYLAVALAGWFWTEICLIIKNRDIDDE